jgi:ATP-dependent Clp protease protease subunit
MKLIRNISRKIKELEMRVAPIIICVNDFTEENANQFIKEMGLAHNTGQPIIPVVIDSYGGDVYALSRMIDAIKNATLPVATIVEGKAMSCGAILMTYGTKGYRYCNGDATVMMHDISTHSFGKIEELRSSLQETDRLQNKILTEVDLNCNQAKGYFNNVIHSKGRADWFINPQEALNIGMCDKLGNPNLKIDFRVDISFKY